ncbi:hypothetical protein ACP70R_008195 [Stipagrostis hirtigluma subsp. patula]
MLLIRIKQPTEKKLATKRRPGEQKDRRRQACFLFSPKDLGETRSFTLLATSTPATVSCLHRRPRHRRQLLAGEPPWALLTVCFTPVVFGLRWCGSLSAFRRWRRRWLRFGSLTVPWRWMDVFCTVEEAGIYRASRGGSQVG